MSLLRLGTLPEPDLEDPLPPPVGAVEAFEECALPDRSASES